jgi:predicted Rossmann fold nucleotide-binding protein DprA/Smf involved in DNA uptake
MAATIKLLQPEEFPPLLREIADPPAELYLEGELPRDELIHQLNLSVSETNALIAVLEIKGIIKETYGEIRLLT